MPVLPLRDTVLFPQAFMPLAVARESSVKLIDEAVASGQTIAVFAQREAGEDEPTQADLHPIGTASQIHKMFKLPDGSLRIIVQGLARVRLDEITATRPYLRGRVTEAPEVLEGQRPPRDRRAAAQHQGELPADRVAVAVDVGRPAGAGVEHHRPGPARGLHRLGPRHDRHRDQAGSAADARRPRAARPAQPPADQGARGPRARLEDPEPGAVGSRQEPARLLPARAAQGDPEGARRRRRPDARDRGAAHQARSRRPARDREEGSAARARSPVEDAAGGRGVHGGAHLSRLDRRAAVVEEDRRGHRPQEDQGHHGRRALGPREGEGSHSRVPRGAQAEARHEGADPVLRRPSGRRQDLARRDRSRSRSAASSCASRSAACATRRRSAAIAAPTSARCPARSSRACAAPNRRTRSSCSTRSTSSAPTSAAIPRRRCSRCSIRSRTTRSAITTSTCRST